MRSIIHDRAGKRFLVNTFSLLALLAASLHPLQILLAEICDYRGMQIVDDRTTEYRDRLDITEETLPLFQHALDEFIKAERWSPAKSRYRMQIVNMSMRLNTWYEIMKRFNAKMSQPKSSITSQLVSTYDRLVLTEREEPLNTEAHYVLGKYYALQGDHLAADREFSRAVDTYPINSQLRANVAVSYLLNGRYGKALEHARILAQNDDSYRTSDAEAAGEGTDYRNTAHLSQITGSYLYQALEIAWRASENKLSTVKAMTPNTPEAQNVLRLFIELKGLAGDRLQAVRRRRQ